MKLVLLCLMALLPVVLSQRCPHGWQMYSAGKTCVLLKTDSKKNYYEAQKACKAHDTLTDLVVIKQDAKDNGMNAWLAKLVKPTKLRFYIGLHDQGAENKFVWVDGKDLYKQKKNVNWNSGEPNNYNSKEDCVEILGSGKWNDVSCSSSKYYICQRPNDIPLDCDEGNGWRVGNDSCLKYFSKETKTWTDARKYCQDREGDLTQIDSTNEQSVLHTIAVQDKWKTFWIGLSDQITTPKTKGQYTWVDGSALGSVKPWAPNQPDNKYFDNGGSCAEILDSQSDGKWTTAACTDKRAFTCEKPKGTCAPGWQIHGGQCYNVYTNTPMTWYAAKTTCEAHRAFLVSVKSDDENSFLARQFSDLKDLNINRIWMGASDSKTDGTFEWADGTKMSSYTKWQDAKNGPKNIINTVDCGFYDTADTEGKWGTGNCYQVRPFICKIKAGEKVWPIDASQGVGTCDVDWNLFNGNCYYFDTNIVAYDTAKKNCELKSSKLTSILDSDEQSYLSMRTYMFQVFLWIGLNDKKKSGTFVWEDQSPYSFNYWAPGQPDHYGSNDGERCAHFRYGELEEGMWNDLPCGNKQAGYICKKTADAGTPPPPKPPPTPTFNDRCGLGWEYDTTSKQCFLFKAGELRTWLSAKEQCMLGGGDLVSITGASEQTYLKGRLVFTTESVVWIGANDRSSEGGWEWSNDSPFRYLNWASGEPNNYGNSGEHCAEFKVKTGLWNDVRCTNKVGYICKKNGFLVSHFSAYPKMYLDTLELVSLPSVYPEDCAVSCVYMLSPSKCLAFNYDRIKKTCKLFSSNKDTAGGLKTALDIDYYQLRSDAPPPFYPPTPLPTNYRCLAGWQAYGDYCFLAPPGKVSWSDARKDCRKRGADLISIRDENENNFMVTFIVQALAPGDTSPFWTGLSDLQVSNTYTWSESSPVLFTNWNKNEPNNHQGTEDCVESYTSGMWNDQDCQSSRRYICKMMREDFPGTQFPTTPSGCDKGWFAYEGSCYKFEDQSTESWNNALKKCKSYSGSLVVITDRFEQAFISSRLGIQPWNKNFWIGLNDRKTKGQYEWEGGAKFDYSHWAKGQPDDTKGSCVLAEPSVSAGLWSFSLCTIKKYYVCEKGRAGYTTIRTTVIPVTTPSNDLCAPGWIGYGSHCYKPYDLNMKLNFWDAETFCMNIGGHLASLHSKSEEDYFVSQVSKASGGYWIGLHDSKAEGGFEWVDGTSVGWTNWNQDPKEPNNAGSGEDCTEMFFTGRGWNDMSCYGSKRNAVCMLPKGQMPATTPPPITKPNCPSGEANFFLYNNYCYYLSLAGEERGWEEAQTFCHQKGAHFVSIHDQSEQDYLYDEVSAAGGDFWIGLREFGKNGIYSWADNTSLDFDAWVNNEPNDFNGEEECVEMYPWKDSKTGGNWNDQNCGTPRNFICKKDYNSVGPITHKPTEVPTGYCPINSVRFLNRCYIFKGIEPEDKLSWKNASLECKKIPGGELATIHSQAVQALLTSNLDKYNHHAWIGLSDITTSHQFKWIDGTTVDYTNWASGEPNEAGAEDCVEMYYDWRKAGQWNDKDCDQLRGYICQAKPSPDNNPPQTQTNLCGIGYSYWAKSKSCFQVLPTPVTFSDAVKACEGLGNTKGRSTTLASLNDPYEAAYGDTLMVEAVADKDTGVIGDHKPLWLGMIDDKVAGEYQWLDKWPILYTKWDTSEPSKGGGEGCVSMAFNGRWDDVDCQNQYGSLCKFSLVTPPTPHPEQAGTCADDWVKYGGHCMYFPPADSELITEYQAEKECRNMGATLVSIRTKIENEFVRKAMRAIRTDSAWLGLYRSDQGGFEWLDFEPVSYVKWAGEEPTMIWDGKHENCVEMYTEYGEWNDNDCGRLKTYVCKKLVTPLPTKKPTVRPPATQKTALPTKKTTVPPPATQKTAPPITKHTGPPTTQKQPVSEEQQTQQTVPSAETSTVGPTPKVPEAYGGGLGAGSIVGIIIGILLAILFICILAFFLIKSRAPQKGLVTESKLTASGFDNVGFDNAVYSTASGGVTLGDNPRPEDASHA